MGGLEKLMNTDAVIEKLDILPDFSDMENALAVFIIPLAVQWWATWYPGAEPGGGGYIAQRMLSAKDEKNAIGATLFFNLAHYALRPWPWILIALASVVVFPGLDDIKTVLPSLDEGLIQHDLAYPAMLTFLPHGLLGLVVASLVAAFMSTISTHLNWGSSYIVNDFYKRFIHRGASQKQMVHIGRASTAVLMLLSALMALALESALQAFQILLTIGAGTGLIFLLRWFWWRINAWTELAGMTASFLVALYFEFLHERIGFTPLETYAQLLLSIGVTSIIWIAVTLLTRPTDLQQLQQFCLSIKPAGPGWKKVIHTLPVEDQNKVRSGQGSLSAEIFLVFTGCITIYATLFAMGYALYGRPAIAITLGTIAIAGTVLIFYVWQKMIKQKPREEHLTNLVRSVENNGHESNRSDLEGTSSIDKELLKR